MIFVVKYVIKIMLHIKVYGITTINFIIGKIPKIPMILDVIFVIKIMHLKKVYGFTTIKFIKMKVEKYLHLTKIK